MAKSISIGNAQIKWRNFAGRAQQYNAEGDRNFCVMIDPKTANALSEDGWNVRWLEPREDEDTERQAYLQVKVSFKFKPPKIVLVSSTGKSVLPESDLDMLDWVDIEYVDVIIDPSPWSMNGRSGIKAYLKTIYIVIAEDEFEKKYSNAPGSVTDCIGGCGNCDECDGSCGCHQ